MKKLMITGGMVGFGIGLGCGHLEQAQWSTLFLRSSLSALAVGLLFRWWGQVWISSLQQAHLQRVAAAQAAAQANPPKA